MTKTLENIVITALVAGIGILGFNSEIRANNDNESTKTQSAPTYVSGIVYSGVGMNTPVVPNAIVDITCNGYTQRDTADAEGFYEGLLPSGVGSIGEAVEACVTDKCSTGLIRNLLPNPLYIISLDIFNPVPVSANKTTWGRLKTLYK